MTTNGIPNASSPNASSQGRPVATMSFEELLDELTHVTAEMDDGAIGIEQAADLYARASELHAAASTRLLGVRARLDELRGGANGYHSAGRIRYRKSAYGSYVW